MSQNDIILGYHVTFWGDVDNPDDHPAIQIFRADAVYTEAEPEAPAIAMTASALAAHYILQADAVTAWEAAHVPQPAPEPDPAANFIERLNTDPNFRAGFNSWYESTN